MGFFSFLWRKRAAKILVVEDSPEIRELIRDVLTLSGYRVTTAADGLHGLACFKKEKFDLMILDYNMPRMGGSELLGLIRATPEGRKQAVIILSAEQMLDPIYKAYDHGIVEWIPKPFTAAALLAKVTAHLKAPPKK
jgi:DNA-binding response OmpR family regulator